MNRTSCFARFRNERVTRCRDSSAQPSGFRGEGGRIRGDGPSVSPTFLMETSRRCSPTRLLGSLGLVPVFLLPYPFPFSTANANITATPGSSQLVLVGCKLDGRSVSPVSEAVAAAENLRELDLSWNPIRGEGIRGVIEAVKQAPRIRRLSVAGCQLGLEGGRVMFSALGEGREVFRLEDLDLSFNSIGAGVGEILEQALRLNQTLTRLNLRANGLGPDGGAKLVAGIAGNCGRLTELLVADNRLGVGVAATVAASMRGGTGECLAGFGRVPMNSRSSISGKRYATTIDDGEGASSGGSNLDAAFTEADDAERVLCDEGDTVTDEGAGKQRRQASHAVLYQ